MDPYLRVVMVLIGVFLAVRVFGWALVKVIPLLAGRTKTDLDDVILERSSGLFSVLAFLVGVHFVLGEFDLGGGLVRVMDIVVGTLLIVVVSILVYRVLDALLSVGYREFGRKIRVKVDKSLLQFFRGVMKVVIMICCFLVVLNVWGVEIGPLLAGLGVAGIAIALAVKPTLANIFGGISILLDKTVSVGDWVKLDDGTSGYVVQVNLRSTKIQTFDNELVIVPNGKLSESSITNVALPSKETRVIVPFSVAYGSDIDKVKGVVRTELKRVSGLFEGKDIVVRFVEMGASCLMFKAFFYVKDFNDVGVAADEANGLIYRALNKAGIEIPFPRLDVRMK